MENQNKDVTITQADATPTQGKAALSRNDALTNLVDGIQDARTKDYVKNRLLGQMKWYSRKSAEYKRQYQSLMTCSIVLGAMIPVTSLLLEGPLSAQVLIASLGAAVTAVNAYLSLNNSKDLWLTYRNTREVLLRTLYFYFNNAEQFSKGTDEEKNEILIKVCEAEMARENGTWHSMFYDGEVTKNGG